MFPWLNGLFYQDESEAELEPSSDESEGSNMEIEVFNNQNAFGLNFIDPKERKRLKKLAKRVVDEDKEIVEPEEEPKSTFKTAIENG
jgi:hypothetical protein